MTDDLYLGLDVGSSSTKAVLVGVDGVVVADARIEHGISRPRPGWAEQDAERDWWGGAVEACRRVVARRASQVRAVGVSALGPCVLAADDGGGPLRPAILYGIDSRAAAQIERLTTELGADEILARCGSRLSSQSAGPKIRWLADEEPGVWSATRRLFGASSYLVSRLTGEYVLDHHSASQWAPLYDVHANAWIHEWAESVAPGLALPRLVWPEDECGAVGREAAAETGLPEGTPVVAGSIDSWCEVAASGLRGPGEGLLVYGTSMFLIEVDSPARTDPAGMEHRGLRAGLAEHRRRGSLGRSAHLLAARPDRRGPLRDAVPRGRRSRTRRRRPPRPALLRRRAHAAVRPGPPRRRAGPDRRARPRAPLPCVHGGRRLRRASQPRDDARGRGDHRRPAQQRRRGGGRVVAADRERRHRAHAGSPWRAVPRGRRRRAVRGGGRRRGVAADAVAAADGARRARPGGGACTSEQYGRFRELAMATVRPIVHELAVWQRDAPVADVARGR